jgi:hypothetical protein
MGCSGQAVISAHAGLILFIDGSVALDGKPFIPRPGRWSEVPENSTLQTQSGKADLLLAPGVFLRLGTNTGIRLLSNKLFDVQVDLLSGSAIVESLTVQHDNSIRFFHNRQQIRIDRAGHYRIDSEPAQVAVQSGQLEILREDAVLTVAEHQSFSIDSGTVHELSVLPPDSLEAWDQQRQLLDNPTPPLAKQLEGWRRRLAKLWAVSRDSSY